MARRAIACGAALAVAIAASVLSAPGSAEEYADSCDQATLSSGTIAGVVGGDNPQDWWRLAALPGSYLVTLVSGPADADLTVGNAGCELVCGSAATVGTDQCTARSTDGGLTIGVRSASHNPSAYTATVAVTNLSLSECSDREDNDDDGIMDHPADTGCSSRADSVEDDRPCAPAPGTAVEVCHEVVAGAEYKRFTVDFPKSRDVRIQAYLRTYRFRVQGYAVPVTCVDLVHPTAVSACGAAGGRFTGAEQPLYPVSSDAPTKLQDLVVRVCDAALEVSAAGRDEVVRDLKTLC